MYVSLCVSLSLAVSTVSSSEKQTEYTDRVHKQSTQTQAEYPDRVFSTPTQTEYRDTGRVHGQRQNGQTQMDDTDTD